MTDCALFDIDGTLSDPTHRLHLIKDKKDWDNFLKLAAQDPIKHDIARLYDLVVNGDNHDGGIVTFICTGRNEDVRDITEQWLRDNNIVGYAALLMRPSGDSRPDYIVKKEMLANIRGQGFEPKWVFDDRQSVVDMWREEGLTCLQVASWSESPTFRPRQPLLTIMVGPTHGGKTHWLHNNNIRLDSIISSDQMRADLFNDMYDQKHNGFIFNAMHEMAKVRLTNSLDVVLDATHLKKKDRLAAVACATKHTIIRYVVCDRPLQEKLLSRRGDFPLDVIHKMHHLFHANKADILAGDNLPNVKVEIV